MGLNKDYLRYVRLLYRIGRSNAEIVEEVIESQIRPALIKEVDCCVNTLKKSDIESFIKIIKELK
jgi:hypothetical protein